MTSLALLLSLPLFAGIAAMMIQFSLLCRKAREEEFADRARRVAQASLARKATSRRALR